MSDTISRQAAIEALMSLTIYKSKREIVQAADKDENSWIGGVAECIDEIEDLPSAQPETHEERTETHACDLISRPAAIDALHMHLMYRMGTDSNKKRLDEWINNLPSAQPEIIRCTECKHYREYDSEYVANAVVVQCMADRYPISETIPDGWFCAGAERKDDE